MKINGLSTYEILKETADIVLSVELSEKDKKEYGLVGTTVWVTYDFKGNYVSSEILDEGLQVEFVLTDEELKQVLRYIEENGLKKELLRAVGRIRVTA